MEHQKRLSIEKTLTPIFSNIQLILKFNSGLLTEIEILTKNWPSKTTIGSLFIDHIPYIKIYTQCLFLLLLLLFKLLLLLL